MKDGDILFTRTGASVGKTYIYEQNDGTVFYAGFLIRANICTNYDPEFIFQNTLTERYDNYIQIISQRSGQPGVNAKEYAEYTLMCPSLLEQKRISSILKRVDELIILQQRKLNELKEVKKTLLSQLFPSKGQYRPIIRFKKFTNKWTKRKLGNIAKIIGGGTPSTSNHDYWNGNINWYSPTEIGNNIFVNSSNKKISIKGLNNSSAKLLPGGKTILFTSRAGIGNMAIMLTDGCTNQGFQSWVIDDTKIDIYFLYSLGRLLKHDAIRQASGSTFLEISNKEVKKLLLEIPSFTEQKLIGNMLRKIDDDIVRQKERIILITKIKKNLLQKLFV
ncbi:hypothetical protein LATKL145_18970 [Lactobacillus amylovorus subsp. animalium]|uniref:Type I restriction modification DNA specificity domain-containing protein n=1 Tax=Lactobacillus amylovorus subsp. animalium TaxID=3378536 RepID=A0ABC9VQW0_LACAM